MKKRSYIAVAATTVALLCMLAAPVFAENKPSPSAAPSTPAAPTPAPAASPAVTTTTPAATTADPAKGSKKATGRKMTRHHPAPKPYEHFVGFDKMF